MESVSTGADMVSTWVPSLGWGRGIGEGVGSWAAQQVTSVLHQVGQVTRLSKSGVVTSEIQADNKFLRGAWDAIWDPYLLISYAISETQAPLSCLGVFAKAFMDLPGAWSLRGGSEQRGSEGMARETSRALRCSREENRTGT